MLKSFQRIKGLGVFADYSPPAGMVDFGAKKLNPELPQCSFTIATDADNINETNFTTSTHVVRVFNSDFIADNLNFAGSHFKPILLLGSESEAAQKEIERCEAMHKRAAELAAAFAKESGDAGKALSSAKTTSSAHIKKTVGLVAAFGSTQLEAELRTVALALSEHTLSEQAFNDDIRLAHTSATEAVGLCGLASGVAGRSRPSDRIARLHPAGACGATCASDAPLDACAYQNQRGTRRAYSSHCRP